MNDRRMLVGLLVAASASICAPAWVQDERIGHQIDQALHYIKKKQPVPARELLSRLVLAEGARSGVAWLALSRAYFSEGNLDGAGSSLAKATELGIDGAIDQDWQARFVERIRAHLGTVTIEGEPGWIEAELKKARPILDPVRIEMLNMALGDGGLRRHVGTPFYLPEGHYQLGGAKIAVVAGKTVTVSLDDVGEDAIVASLGTAAPLFPDPSEVASTTVPEFTADRDTSAPGEPGGPLTASSPAAAEPGWFSSNWGWVAVGAAAIAGGVATAVIVSSSGDLIYELDLSGAP